MVATGTVPIRPEIEGIDSKRIFGLSTLQSGIDLRMALDEELPERAVVVGGGYIGLEGCPRPG
ncbi:MAG: FAD-dependent oxidoreductase [Actinomycetota bacterium]